MAFVVDSVSKYIPRAVNVVTTYIKPAVPLPSLADSAILHPGPSSHSKVGARKTIGSAEDGWPHFNRNPEEASSGGGGRGDTIGRAIPIPRSSTALPARPPGVGNSVLRPSQEAPRTGEHKLYSHH